MDTIQTRNRANDYYQVLLQAQQSMVTLQSLPKLAHQITAANDGIAAVFNALTGLILPVPSPTPTPTPSATATPSGTPTPTATPKSTPVAPTALTATAVSSNQINLSWADNSTDETSFGVQRSLDGNTFASVATLGPNVITYCRHGRSSVNEILLPGGRLELGRSIELFQHSQRHYATASNTNADPVAR